MRTWLKEARTEAGLTCEQMAEKLDVSVIYYRFIETDRRQQNMTIDMAFRLSKALQIPLERIIAYELH